MTPRKCNCYNEPGLCDFCLAALRARCEAAEKEKDEAIRLGCVEMVRREMAGFDRDAALARALAAERSRDDLLGALRAISDTYPDDDETPQDYRKRLQHIARAAIAKVGGGEK